MGAAVKEHSSKAAFLSGSFGAGKSNFMGMLQLLLDGNPAALAQAGAGAGGDVDERVARRPAVPDRAVPPDRRDLARERHLRDLRQARAKLHPEAPLPDVFADEPILDNADTLRQRLGDEAFFAALNETDGGGSSGDDGWGDLGGWDAARYDAARLQPVDGDDRRLLVQALLADLLSSYAEGAAANREGYVDIDSGLAAISRHAHSLGYCGRDPVPRRADPVAHVAHGRCVVRCR